MAEGDRRVWAFLDGEPFSAVVKKGQAPVAAVTRSLKKRLGADVTLWPQEATPYGAAYRVQWFDSKSDRFREGRVEIWRLAGGSNHATKKKRARSELSKHHQDLLARRKPGGGLRAGYLTPAGWHGDPMVIEDRKLRLEALRAQAAPRLPKDRSRSHATVKADDRYTAKQRAAQAEIKLNAIPTSQWSRDRVVAVLRDVDTEALRVIEHVHLTGAGIFTAGRQVAKWAREVLDERGSSSHATRRGTAVEVDTSVYRRYHGAEPRGFGDWSFVIGKREYEHSDDPALYRPAYARGAQKAGRTGLSFARAKEHAIAEAKRRGATIVGVAP